MQEHVNAKAKSREKGGVKRWSKGGIIAIVLALVAVIGVASLAFFTDRVDHSMQFTTSSFTADGYTLTRVAPDSPFCAGETVTATLKESNTGEDDINSVISMKATWTSPDNNLSIFGNASAADNAVLSIGGTNVNYTVSADKKSITFDLPKHMLAKGTNDKARDLSLTIPESFKSTGRINFTFEKVVVGMDGSGFSKTFSRTDLNADSKLDYSVRVGWAASSIAAQNGKALMGYLTDKNSSGKFGIEFEFAYNYTESPMKDFSSRTGAKWSYYKGAVDRLTFAEGMTTIGDYAFPDFSSVKSISFPTTVKTIGLSAFDASGLTGEVTIPATVKEIKSLAFGNLPNVNTFTFGHTTNSLTLPDNTAADKRNTGAFYVPTHVDTTVNTTVEAIMYGYKWHDGYDNRRLVPTLNAQDTWFRTYTGEHNYEYTAKLDEEKLETVTFADYHMPVVGETSWDASDPSVPGTVTAFLSADKKSLILAGNGYGLIFANEDSSGAFANLTGLKTISNTDLLDTRNATTMADMFNFDQKLANISVTTWNVSKVESMSNMFYCCDSLPSIDLRPNTCTAKDGSGQYTAWNTASLKNTGGMFMDYGGPNYALTTVDTTGWDTSKLEEADYMFMECRSLTEVKGIENWDVSSLKDAHNMFQDCEALETINVADWKTTSLENTSVMFSSCHSLRSIDITKWDMSKVTKSNAMFSYCKSFTELTLPKSLLVIGSYFAGNCPKLTTITFNHPAGTDIQFSSEAFYIHNNDKAENEAGYVEYTPVDPLGTKVVTSNAQVLDYDWTSDRRGYKMEIKTVEGGTLTGTPLATYNGRKAVVAINGKTITFTATATGDYVYDGATIQYSQNGTTKTETLDKNTKTWVMPVVDDKVTEADVVVTPKWKVSAIPMLAKEDTWQYNGTDTDGNPTTAIDYDLLETINIVDKYTPASGETSWDASANETVDGVEYKGKVTVYLSADKKTLTISGNGYGRVYANPNSMWAMTKAYDGMSALKNISGADILDMQLVVNAGGMFAQNRKLESVDVSKWNTGKIQNTSAAGGYYGMFMNCAKLKVLDVSKWDTKSMTEMIRMFSGCETVTTLDVSGWKTAKATNMNEMFAGAGIAQIAVNGSGWDTSNLVSSYGMFEDCANLTQIDLSTWDVSKLEKTFSMFENSGLTKIDLSTWDESIVTSVYGMFRNCKALTSVNINGWNLSNLEDGTTDDRKGSAGIFSGCTALTKLTIPSSLKVFGRNFAANCTSLTTIEFLHDAGTVLTFPTAGTTYGAFYVPSYLETNIVGTNASAQGYAWSTDNRKHEMISVPAQVGTLTYNEKSQSPTWNSNYVPEKMTMSGTTSGINAGSYTATFTPKAGYTWTDGTSMAKSVTWKIGKAAGSLTLSKSAATIDYNATTTTFTVTRAGNGAITVTSSNTAVATVSVSDTTVTVTKKAAGTATISVEVAEGTNHLAPAKKTCEVTCQVYPTLAAGNSWYKGTTDKSTITGIEFIDSGMPSGTVTESWDASAAGDGSVKAYIVGTKLTLVGNGSGKIYANTDSSQAFESFTAMTTFSGTDLLDTSQTTTMLKMFNKCNALNVVKGLSGWNTANVTSMSYMFNKCSALTNVGDLSGWNTSKVTNMSYMFNQCKALSETDLSTVSGWDTSNVTNMRTMFQLCEKLTTLDLSHWDTSKVTNMGYMFNYCSALTNVGDLSGWDTSKVTDMSYMFSQCKVLSETDLSVVSGWDTSNVTNMRTMFQLCEKLTTLDLSGWNTSKVTNMTNMFNQCKALTNVGDISGWDTSKVTDMSSMFKDCQKLTTLDLSGWDTSNVTTMNRMFGWCYALTNVGDLSHWNTSKVTNMDHLFFDCSLTSVGDLSGWDTSKVTNMCYMFTSCSALTSVGDLSGWNTSNVHTMASMFYNCGALTSLGDLSGWDTSNVTDMSFMFCLCRALTSVGDLSGWNTSKVTNMSSVFSSCGALTSLDLSGWNTSNVNTMENMFYGCGALTSLDLSGWNTSKVTNMANMFVGCNELQTVTLGKDFKFIGTDSYLPTPSSAYISGADGKWYDTADGAGYTPEELAGVTRTETRTYSAAHTTRTTRTTRSLSLNTSGDTISGYSISD